MKNMSNLEIEDRFLSSFDCAWNETLEHYKCRQAQLNSGSRLRPLMVLWGYIANVAVSIELIHKGTILLDDWIDQDEARHGEKAFSDIDALSAHKGAANDDISISRKNLGVALLYNVAKPADQQLILNKTPGIVYELMQTYHILDFILKKIELYYDNISTRLRKNAGLSSEWVEGYIQFMNRMKQKAYGKLGIE